MNRFVLCACFLMSFLLGTTEGIAQEVSDKILGEWWTASKEAKVEIYKCGDKYCGKLSWLKEPNEEDGSPKVDDENPDPKLRSRKLLNLEILYDFEYDEDLEWEDGEIYDAKSGKTYSCILTLEENYQVLNVRGYIGFSFIGRTETWQRAR